MTFWLFIAGFLAAIGLLTWVGVLLVKKNPGTEWEKNEDHPFIGHHDF